MPAHSGAALWGRLHKRRVGLRFRRHHVVSGVFLDLFCVELLVGVRVGSLTRTEQLTLAQLGIAVLWLSPEEVLERPRAAVDRIVEACQARMQNVVDYAEEVGLPAPAGPA